MRPLLLAAQLAMVVLFCAAFGAGRFFAFFLPWVGIIPSVLLLFVGCFATELTLFGRCLARDDSPGEANRRRACFVLYTFAFVIVDGWTTIAVLVYAAALRLVVARDRMFHAHTLPAIALALALIIRRDTLYSMEKRLIVIDALAVGVLALTIVALVIWTLRTSARTTSDASADLASPDASG